MFLAHLHDPAGIHSSLFGHLGHPLEEGFEPAFPVATIADCLKPIVVLRPVELEEVRKIEQRPFQDLLFAQQKGDQQAPDSSVSVEERMNGLELRMSDPHLDERRHWMFLVQELLKVVERLSHLMWRRRRISRVCQRRTGRVNAVLRMSKLARITLGTSDALRQLLM